MALHLAGSGVGYWLWDIGANVVGNLLPISTADDWHHEITLAWMDELRLVHGNTNPVKSLDNPSLYPGMRGTDARLIIVSKPRII